LPSGTNVLACGPSALSYLLLSRARHIVPIPGTSHRRRLEENAAAATIQISADTEHDLLKLFAPGAAGGLRYPENHLVRLGI
jgi:diketogulonate reductase-like aldo/keto reductase